MGSFLKRMVIVLSLIIVLPCSVFCVDADELIGNRYVCWDEHTGDAKGSLIFLKNHRVGFYEDDYYVEDLAFYNIDGTALTITAGDDKVKGFISKDMESMVLSEEGSDYELVFQLIHSDKSYDSLCGTVYSNVRYSGYERGIYSRYERDTIVFFKGKKALIIKQGKISEKALYSLGVDSLEIKDKSGKLLKKGTISNDGKVLVLNGDEYELMNEDPRVNEKKKNFDWDEIATILEDVGWGDVNSTKKTSENKLNISIFTIQQRQQPSANNPTYKWIEEKFGVTFSWDILLGDKDQKIATLIASGNLPDLVEVDSEKFQRAGCLRDLKPLLEQYAPNLMKHYSTAWKQMIDCDSEKDANGNITVEHIYSLPNYGVYDGVPSDTNYNPSAWWIQKDVLREFGYPTIKTIDEYFDLLEKYYKKYPTIDGLPTIPFNIITAAWEYFDLINPPNFLAGYPNDGNGHVAKIDGKYTYVDNFTDENAKRWFKLANGYYQRGLIDPASFTDNRDQYYAKIAQGRVLGMFIQGWQFMGDNAENALWSAGKDERTYAPLAITFDETIKPHYRDRSLPNLQRGYGITTKCPEDKAIKILQFMDKMIEEENQKVLYWGFEGQDYCIDTDGSKTGTKGAAYRYQAQRDQQKDPDYNQNHFALLWREEAPKLEGMLPSGYTRTMDELPWEYALSQKQVDLDLWEAYGVGSYAEFMDPNPPQNSGWYPMWQCNPSSENGGLEGRAYRAMMGFEDIQRKYLPQLIMCKPDDFDKTWDEYCNQLKPLTVVYNKFMQQQLDCRIKKFGGDNSR